MNAAEARYAARVLDPLVASGAAEWYAYEPFKLKLGKGSYYTPDFAVLLADGAMEIHEFKGHWREAARVRIKTAASRFPFFRFLAVYADEKVRGGYAIEEVPAGEPDVTRPGAYDRAGPRLTEEVRDRLAAHRSARGHDGTA